MRFGLIGTGHWATSIHGRGVANHPTAELVGVWGRDPARAKQAADQLGARAYEQLAPLIADVDALTFAVPPDVQASLATSTARAGKHVLLEKPIATSVAAAQQLRAAVEQGGGESIVFFTRRFVPELESWLEHLRQTGGWECARVEMAAAVFADGNPFGNSPWRRDKGALWDVGPHALSTLIPLLGSVESVVAGAGVRDQVHLVLRHGGRGSSTVSLSLTVPPAAVGNSLYVYGEHGREQAPSGPSIRRSRIGGHWMRSSSRWRVGSADTRATCTSARRWSRCWRPRRSRCATGGACSWAKGSRRARRSGALEPLPAWGRPAPPRGAPR